MDISDEMYMKTKCERWQHNNCGLAFFTCAPTWSARLVFIGEKIVLEKVGVATYFIFILKGK